MATTIDLTTLSLEHLDALIADVQVERERRRALATDEALMKIHEIAEAAGLSLSELVKLERTHKRSKVPVKYRNPANSEQGWSGRGKRPRWIEEALSQGKTLESLLVG
jgi:DNA-binding protein H-NS